jgi:hypothetical protein
VRAAEINRVIGHDLYFNCPTCGLLFSKKLKLHQSQCTGVIQNPRPQVEEDQGNMTEPTLNLTGNVLSEEMSDELDEMRPYLCSPLQYTHYTWRPVLRQISEKLLTATLNRESTPRAAADAFNCHIILPGLVQGKRNQIIAKRKSSRQKHSSPRVLDLLNAFNAHTNPITAIYKEAQAQYRTIQKRKWNKRVPTVGSQKRKCEKLIGEGRFSTAMTQVATITRVEKSLNRRILRRSKTRCIDSILRPTTWTCFRNQGLVVSTQKSYLIWKN